MLTVRSAHIGRPTFLELVHGQLFLKPGESYNGTLPIPVAVTSGNETGNIVPFITPFLVGVLVARTTSSNESTSIIKFDPSTVQVISASVPVRANATDATVAWTAPQDGTYVLVAAYGWGTGQVQNMYDST